MVTQPKSRVLVVEDDPEVLRIIAINLAARGNAVRKVTNVAQAVDALAEETPNLLILDVNLPDRTGWDVLREADLPAEVRVLMLSAVPVSLRRLADVRPVAYLPKPFPLDALLRLAEPGARMTAEDA
jgi:DNA-binding response OmpR family regulator